MAQLQHNMWVTHLKTAVLSIITGGGKWVEITVPMDPLYLSILVSAEKKFWRCVQSGEIPHLINAEPPRPRIEAIRIVDMNSSNSWAEFAALFRNTRAAFLDHERAKTELKSLIPEDARGGNRAWGAGKALEIRCHQLRCPGYGGRPCNSPVNRSPLLAAALAKAQAQLVNPEKSLTATIRTGRTGETERTFRYAPLSSGLEIVRKTLSEQEIAVIQTTAIDPASRILNLTTTLAHSSGQWIASQWPVCPLADIASPHRMGAALTYARRYALFTLVGIAGEDDLDAPDLCTPAPAVSPSVTGVQVPPKTSGNGRMSGAARAASSTILPAEQSAALRDRLVSEIAGLAIAGQRGRLGQGGPSSQEHAHRSRCKVGGNRICPEAIRFLAIRWPRAVAARICSRRLRRPIRLPRPIQLLLPNHSARAAARMDMRPAGSTRACSR